MILYGYILYAYTLWCRMLPYYVVGRWTAQRRWKAKIWNKMPFHDPNCIKHYMQEQIHDPMDQIRTGDLSPPNSNSTTKLRSLTCCHAHMKEIKYIYNKTLKGWVLEGKSNVSVQGTSVCLSMECNIILVCYIVCHIVCYIVWHIVYDVVYAVVNAIKYNMK